MTVDQEKELIKIINKVILDNKEIVLEYRNGKRGLIGTIMKKIIKESTISFYSKSSKQKLVYNLKKNMNETKIS
jgi:Asp-tRNA(Asn)/Glu-tRNA(Gln) amidotransferase B subunit